jgi:hypothetical protein
MARPIIGGLRRRDSDGRADRFETTSYDYIDTWDPLTINASVKLLVMSLMTMQVYKENISE